MIDAVLPKLTQHIEALIEKNKALSEALANAQTEKNELAEKITQLTDENETLQLEILEQEEKQSDTVKAMASLLTRLEETA